MAALVRSRCRELRAATRLSSLCRYRSTQDNRDLLLAINERHKQRFTYHSEAEFDNTSSRPLVLLIGWLNSQQKHMTKYCDLLYNPMGMDSVTILPKPQHVLDPKQAQAAARAVVELVTSPEFASRPILVHGFSVGGYLWGCSLLELQTQNLLDQAKSSIRCAIFDSPVDLEGIPYGVAAATFKNPVLRLSAQKGIEAIMALNKSAMTLYRDSSNAFKADALRLPKHVMYSHYDAITDAARIEQVMNGWGRDSEVSSTLFDDSEHVMHMRRYFNDYKHALEQFVLPKLA